MPVLVDTEPEGGGEPITVFESGAIMIYLAKKHGKFLPKDVRGETETLEWVIWQVGLNGGRPARISTFTHV